MDSKTINRIINQGVNFLAKEQQKDGAFLSLSSPNPNDFKNAKEYHTTFPTSLILSCLNTLEETPEAQTIKQKIVSFLLTQRTDHWSFNYFVRDSKNAKVLAFPDDLDDTFCALSSLFQYNPELIDGSAMAKIVTLLTAVEEKEGGPYRTWLVPKTAEKVWKDIDLAVNSNVAYFLSLQGISLPRLNSLIEKAIDTNAYSSPYYFSSYPVIYFISRFYRGKKIKKIKDFLISKRDKAGKWDNPSNTALAVSTLLNIGFPVNKLKESILYLINRCQDGAWEPYALGIDPAIKGKTYYGGSSTLTTALCLEALARYKKAREQESRKTKRQEDERIRKQERTSLDFEAEKIYKEVVERVKERFSLLGDDLRKQSLKMLERTLKSDKDKQIVLLPYLFKLSLGQKGKSISDDLIIQFGLATLCGWVAYTIYDDFLDKEGNPELLSIANVALRQFTEIANRTLSEETGFYLFFKQTIDKIDSANTWEVMNCRIDSKLQTVNLEQIPDYGDFSKIGERSLGHALGPVAILFSLGYTNKSPEVKKLMEFFKSYLIARQLNDDAHDWVEDLKKGNINAVGSLVLRKVKKEKSPNLDLSHLQEVFWYEVCREVYHTIARHIKLAKQTLRSIPVIADTSLFEQLLVPIEYSVRKTLKEQEETVKFLKTYEGRN